MEIRRLERSRGQPADSGFTLIELVMTIAVVGVVSLAPATVMLESIRVYVRASAGMDAGYQARLAAESLRRDIRALDDSTKLGVVAPGALSLVSLDGDAVAYLLTGDRLTRNGDLLAAGVTEFDVTFRTQTGATSVLTSEVTLVQIALTIAVGDEWHRVLVSVCPGFARYVARLEPAPAPELTAGALSARLARGGGLPACDRASSGVRGPARPSCCAGVLA